MQEKNKHPMVHMQNRNLSSIGRNWHFQGTDDLKFADVWKPDILPSKLMEVFKIINANSFM